MQNASGKGWFHFVVPEGPEGCMLGGLHGCYGLRLPAMPFKLDQNRRSVKCAFYEPCPVIARKEIIGIRPCRLPFWGVSDLLERPHAAHCLT